MPNDPCRLGQSLKFKLRHYRPATGSRGMEEPDVGEADGQGPLRGRGRGNRSAPRMPGSTPPRSGVAARPSSANAAALDKRQTLFHICSHESRFDGMIFLGARRRKGRRFARFMAVGRNPGGELGGRKIFFIFSAVTH